MTEQRRVADALRASEERFRLAFGYAATGMALVAPDGRFLQVNHALRRSEERFRLATLATNDGIWDLDRATGKVWWNDTYDRFFGPRPLDTNSSWSWWLNHVHPEDRDRIETSLRTAMASHVTHWSDEYRFLRSDGRWAYVVDRSHLARDSRGKATRIIGAMTDLTDRKRAEEEIRESERFLRAVLDSLSAQVGPGGFWPSMPPGSDLDRSMAMGGVRTSIIWMCVILPRVPRQNSLYRPLAESGR